MPSNRESKVILFGVAIAFAASGCAALIYETLWVRILTLYFGHTHVAIASVFSAFMAGLSIGSFIGGRYADRICGDKYFKVFALLEGVTALCALLTKPAIQMMQPVLLSFDILKLSLTLQSVIWFSVSFLLLIIPTALMGATLPLLIKGLLSTGISQRAERATGYLYGINTFGAVIGTAIAGFYLLPVIGIGKSFLVAVVFNGLAAIVSLCVGFLLKADKAGVRPDNSNECGVETVSDQRRLLPMLILFIAGFASMSCEIAWTRAFASILGSSTYAFSIMLFTFFIGFSGGSSSIQFIMRRQRPGKRGLTLVLTGLTLSLLISQPVYNYLPYWFVRLSPLIAQSLPWLHGVQIALCATTMIIPAFFMGMLYPWMIGLACGDSSCTGKLVGNYYAVNTLGNIAGSTISGLFLLPLIGAEQTLMIMVILYVLTTILTIFWGGGQTPVLGKAGVSAFLVLVLFASVALLPRWDPYVISSGSFMYASVYDAKSYRDFRDDLHRFSRLLYYHDGFSATVAVFKSVTGTRSIRTNGKIDASSSFYADMPTQLFSGYLPVLLHPGDLHAALLVGLGSGVTAGAIAQSPGISTIDCVEIEPSFADAARFFARENHGVLDDPRLHIIFADARQYLAAANKKYDIIVSEPSNVWVSGVASLFTRESFELTRRRLAKGGIACQWIHGYSLSVRDFKMVLKTFSDVFPHTMLFRSRRDDYFLFGSNDRLQINYPDLKQMFDTMPLMQKDLQVVGLDHPLALLSATFVLDDAEIRSFSKDAMIHKDDVPVLEFSSPYSLYRSGDNEMMSKLRQLPASVLPGIIAVGKVPLREKVMSYNKASRFLLGSANSDRADVLIKEVLRLDPSNIENRINESIIYEGTGDREATEQSYRKALKLAPRSAYGWCRYGLFVSRKDTGKGVGYFRKGINCISDAYLRGQLSMVMDCIDKKQYKEADMKLAQITPRSYEGGEIADCFSKLIVQKHAEK